MNVIARREQERHLNELVAAACRLVGSDQGVLSVRVVRSGRPTFDELCCYQESAQAGNVRLSVDGRGIVTVRPAVTPEE